MYLSVDIKKTFNDFTLNLKLETEKKILGILGASGSGKSMTLRCIAGLITPDVGRIILDDRVVFDSAKKINVPVQKRGVGFVFQNYALFPNLTVWENIAFGLRKLPKNQRIGKIQDKLKMVQLSGLEERYPHQLSGGQQQRIALARALVTEPDYLLLDEPFSALDNYIRRQLEKEMIETLNSFKGMTLYVTHNLEECYRVSKDILVLNKGKKAAFSSREKLFQSPPNTQAARLTGCNNISQIKILNEETIRAIDWDCDLKLRNQDLEIIIDSPGSKYIGIRDHHISFANNLQEQNTIHCWAVQVIETPDMVTLYLNLKHPPKDIKDYHIQMRLFRDTYAKISRQVQPWHIVLRPEHLFIMEGYTTGDD